MWVVMSSTHLDTSRHPITDQAFQAECRERLDQDGALVLQRFASQATIDRIVDEFAGREADAYYASRTHNVYLTPTDSSFPQDHPLNRQVVSSKGLIADDEIASDSALRDIYEDPDFRNFLCRVLGIDEIFPYADDLSSINVHFAAERKELGWHFDNSAFAVTMLLQTPTGGGRFEYVPNVCDTDEADMAYERVGLVLDGDEPVETLEFEPGDLVVFRGRNALHRVTPTQGDVTRILVVFAYNDEPGIALSESALATFYGRSS